MKTKTGIELTGTGIGVSGLAAIFLNSNTIFLNPAYAPIYQAVGYNPLLMAFPNLISGAILCVFGFAVALFGVLRK